MEFNEHTPGRAFLGVKYLIALAHPLFGEHAAQITEALENLERDGTLETVYRYVETRIIDPIAEQIKAKQAEPDQARIDQEAKADQARIDQEAKAEQARIDQEAKAEQGRIDEQAKAEYIKADAELAAEVIERETIVVEQKIAEHDGKSAGENDALSKDFAREQKELGEKLDGLAKNYFDKYPDMSEDQREEAEKTFKGIKDEAMDNLRGDQEKRLGEQARTQQQQRGELEERRKELEGTRAR